MRIAGSLGVMLMAVLGSQLDGRIPRSGPAVIDGRLDDAEWSGALRQSSRSGLQVRLQHDSSSLFISISAPIAGFTSLCLGNKDAVRVMHASAALGFVDYLPSGGPAWTTNQKFVFGMRNPALTAEAAAERRAYLAQHGWVASTGRMGGDRNQEFQLELKGMTTGARLALGYYVTAGEGSVLTWPDTLAASDGCADINLLRGPAPPTLTFDPSRWAAMSLAP